MRRATVAEQAQIEAWNHQHPIGTLVLLYERGRKSPATRKTRTRSIASLAHGGPVVELDGLGEVRLSECEPVDRDTWGAAEVPSVAQEQDEEATWFI